MAGDPVSSLRVSEIKDPSALFERYSTEEIRRVERKVRGEIEQKKEESRQMVGERYRDSIDAADTIGEMRQCSGSVVDSIRDMQQYCHTSKQGRAGGGGPKSENQNQKEWQEKFYTMASQIKLLSEIPERIWSSSEASQYLQATQLYSLCCHSHSQSQSEAAGGRYSPVSARFPILVRQVATTGHFRSTISVDSRSVSRGRAVSDQAIAEASVSTMSSEDSSPRQASADFLLARKASIHQSLNQPQHGAGIKAQVCSSVESSVTTLFQAYAVFYMPAEGTPRPAEGASSCGMLFSTSENVTSCTPTGRSRKVSQEEWSTSSWFRYSPPSIAEFQPTLRTSAQPIQTEQLRDTSQQWIDTCRQDICHGVGSLSVYVRSLKASAAIRDAVWDLLSTDSISQHWGYVCQQSLGRPSAVWEDFSQQLFLQRSQTITKEETEAIAASSVQLSTSAVRDSQGHGSHGAQYEADVASFSWSESAGDSPSDAAWVSVAQRGQQQQQRSGLAMKTQASTPCVQNFCSSSDAKLKARSDDLQHYLPSPDTGLDSNSGPPDSSSFNRYTDSPAVEESSREGCSLCVRHILTSIRSSSDSSPTSLSSVLFMARLCQSVAELCPSSKHCISGRQAVGDAAVKGTPRQGKKSGKSKAATEVSPAQAKWTESKEELHGCSMESYRIWSSVLAKGSGEKFGAALSVQSAGEVSTTATSWEDSEIQEESESGNSVTSKIRLPVQPSWFSCSSSFQLCVEVNRVGGHALPRPTLQELLQSCLLQASHHYDVLAEQTRDASGPPMTQNRALQSLFDLRYSNATSGSRSEEGKTSRSQQDPRFHKICDWSESFIDPFDSDVFTPPSNANLNRSSQRTSVSLGLSTGSEKQFAPRSSTVNSQEPYNISPSASSQIRFGLLPLSMSNARKSKSSSRGSDVSQNSAPQSSTAESDDSFRPGSVFRQSADQDDDAASPSSFKLSWSAGMAK